MSVTDHFIRETFNEDEWVIYLVDDDDEVISDANAGAHTDLDTKEVFVRRGELSVGVIKHELWHVYNHYLYLSDTNEISLDDMEEIQASLFSDKGERIIERAKKITNTLLEVRERMDNESNN